MCLYVSVLSEISACIYWCVMLYDIRATYVLNAYVQLVDDSLQKNVCCSFQLSESSAVDLPLPELPTSSTTKQVLVSVVLTIAPCMCVMRACFSRAYNCAVHVHNVCFPFADSVFVNLMVKLHVFDFTACAAVSIATASPANLCQA